MAGAVENMDGYHEARVFDLETRDFNLDDVVAADVVGVTVTAFTVEPAVEVARAAKRAGATVLFGGIHSSLRSEQLLQEYDCIDAICTGQGERALQDLARGVPLTSARNLLVRDENKLLRTSTVREARDDLAKIDRRYLDLPTYLNAFSLLRNRFCPDLPYQAPVSVFSQVGCAFRDRTGGCLFCSRMKGRVEIRPAEAYWEEVLKVEEELGADMIWDFSDSFPADPEWMDSLIQARPSNVRSGMYVYGRADELSPENLDRLAALNVRQVLMGIETADKDLKKHKQTTTYQDIEAIKGMRERGISVFPSFCLGLDGETKESVEKTVEFARYVAEIGQPREIACSILIPFVGTPAFVKLARQCPEARAAQSTAFTPPEQLQRWWVKTFSKVEWPVLVEAMHEVLRLAPLKSTFGAPVMADREPYCDQATLEQLTFEIRRAAVDVNRCAS
jgi:anaerobic magnesium-protoporphyrin IX monomethyl ester cyclase